MSGGSISSTLVAGLGSTILTDDGVGVRVVQELAAGALPPSVHAVELGTAGLGLLDAVAGYDRLIIVDAMVTGAPPGSVVILRGSDVARTQHLGGAHEADLPTLLALGQQLPDRVMPRDVVVVAIEAEELTRFSEKLTPRVAAAVPSAVAAVRELFAGS